MKPEKKIGGKEAGQELCGVGGCNEISVNELVLKSIYDEEVILPVCQNHFDKATKYPQFGISMGAANDDSL